MLKIFTFMCYVNIVINRIKLNYNKWSFELSAVIIILMSGFCCDRMKNVINFCFCVCFLTSLVVFLCWQCVQTSVNNKTLVSILVFFWIQQTKQSSSVSYHSWGFQSVGNPQGWAVFPVIRLLRFPSSRCTTSTFGDFQLFHSKND